FARSLLADDGLLVVQVPNAGSWQARRFGPDWFALDVPRHRYHFDESARHALLGDAGFEPIETLRFSETHDAHAFKQSLKSRLLSGGAPLGRLRYYAAARFAGLAARVTGGATL